jgi:signal transduction histidine kinase
MNMFKKWNHLSIRMKLFSGFLAIVLTGGIGMLILNVQLLNVVRNSEEVTNQSVPKLVTQLQVKSMIMERINFVMLYVTTGNEDFVRKFDEASGRAAQIEKKLLDGASPQEKSAVEQFIYHSEDWEFLLRDRVIPVYQLGNKKDAILTLNTEAQPIAVKLMNEVEKLSQRKSAELYDIYQDAIANAWSAVKFSYVVIGVILVLAIYFALYLSRMMTHPVLFLLHGVRKMTKGDFTARVDVKNRDELGELGNAFNQMSISISQLVAELQMANIRLKEESARAQEATRLKSEFLANMSHELRTPLTGIIGFAELIYEGKAVGMPIPSEKQYATNIINAAEHLLSMINDILDLTKIEAGKYELELSHFNLAALIDSALTMLAPRAEKKGVRLIKNIPDAIKPITADEIRIKQILINLLSNAIKFSSGGSEVSVSVEQANESLRIRVIDQGIGIEADKLDKIFEQFYQNDGRLERKYEGTGLGLALTKELVELHGGTITVDSTIHEGSIFTVCLPALYQADSKLEKLSQNERAGNILLLYTAEFASNLAAMSERLQKNTIHLDAFMVKSEEEVNLPHIPDYDLVIVADVNYKTEYLNILESIRSRYAGMLLAYFTNTPRFVERGQLMRLADRVVHSVDEIL